MNSAYAIGTSIISVGQRVLDVVGQNIANANTVGYHRQDASLISQVVDPRTGSGVDIAQIRRFTADTPRAALRATSSETGRLDARLTSQTQVENLLRPGTSGIDGRIESFFNQITTLTTRPDDASQRRVLLSGAVGLTQQIRNATGTLETLRNETAGQLNQIVREINDTGPRIAQLNANIARVEVAGGQANDLRDQRDQLINDLASKIDVRIATQDNGIVNVIAGGVPLVTGDQSGKFQVATSTTPPTTGQLFIQDVDSGRNVNPQAGKVAGLLEEINTSLPQFRDRLDQLARNLITSIGAVQSTGLTSVGPLTSSQGAFSVSNPSAFLSTQDLPLAPQAGNLAISVTNLATGQRSIAKIAIDPDTQSLADVAGAFSTVTNGQVIGSVDPSTKTLRIQAQPGFAFDFAGRLPSPPTGNTGGTAIPQVTGTFRGSENDSYTFNVQGTGTVGTTAGLKLELRNGANTVLGTYDIGPGYTPNAPIDVGNGITVRLNAGTVDNGTFSTPVTGKPDEAGILTALGVNGFFSGSNAQDIRVRDDLLADPSKLAISRSGISGDGSNLQRFLQVREAKSLFSGTMTLGEYAIDIAGQAGAEVASLSDESAVQDGLTTKMFADEQSLVGVDINEEMLTLLRFQRMVQSGSKYLSVVNTALDSVMDIIR